MSRTMKEVPETGSIPVSPMTRTAMAPKRNGQDKDRCENYRSSNRESTHPEDDDHRKEGQTHEDWNMHQRPLIPALLPCTLRSFPS